MDSHVILLTFVSASVLGVLLLLLAHRLKLSAIVVLLLGGIIAGPELLGLVQPRQLGAGLNTIISLAVGLILFEGGLTLDIKGYRKSSREIWGILTKGVLITWLAGSLSVRLIFGFQWSFCFFAASLIIVTGPTVIGPLLQRVRVKKNLHHILHWEGVLIDPIGVFLGLLCYEWIISSGTSQAYLNFFSRFLVGAALGLVFGQIIFHILRKDWIPEEKLNIFVLVMAMLNFAIADSLVSESGLLSVTVAGFIIGYRDTPRLSQIIRYKVELKDFLIGLLFVLLAANLELSKFLSYGSGLIVLVAIVLFIIRPLNIFFSTFRSDLQTREKLFLSWIAPRGIVAASMASLFAFNLNNQGYQQAAFLEAFTYSVIAATVLFQGFTAKWVANWLGVLEPKATGWLIVGAHKFSRSLASFIRDRGHNVVLLDTNHKEVQLATSEGHIAIWGHAMTIARDQHPELYDVGNVLAITENEELNGLVCQHWEKILSRPNLYRWSFDETAKTNGEPALLTGTPVLFQFHLKSLLTQYADVDIFPSRRKKAPVERYLNDDRVLAYHDGEQIRLGSPIENSEPEAHFLLAPSKAVDVIPTEEKYVIFSRASSLEKLYNEMLKVLEDERPVLNRDEVLKELVRREEEFTSLVGHGIALPHTYVEEFKETVILVAKVTPHITCEHTGSEISLVFMILSPNDQPEEHLHQLSKMAQFIIKEQNRQALLEAENPKALFDLIVNE